MYICICISSKFVYVDRFRKWRLESDMRREVFWRIKPEELDHSDDNVIAT